AVSLYNPIVSSVDNIDVLKSVHCNINNLAELTGKFPSFAESAEEHTLRAKNLNPPIPSIRHADVTFRAYRHTGRRIKLTFATAGLPQYLEQTAFQAVFLQSIITRIGHPEVPLTIH